MRPQPIHNMLLIIVEGKTAMGEAEHAVVVRAVSGEKSGAAGRTSGGRVKGLAKENTFGGELLEIGGRDIVTIGLDVAAGVVRVQVEDVGPIARGGLRAGGQDTAGGQAFE